MAYAKARKISQFKNFNSNNMMIGRTLSFEAIKSISDQTMPKGGASQGVFNMMYVAGMGCLANKFFKEYGKSIKEGELVSFGFTEKGDGNFFISWQPGIVIRTRYIHNVFMGLAVTTDLSFKERVLFGLHLGISF